jgi:hypothetical protein
MIDRLEELPEFEPPLDPGIKRYVEILFAHGIETYESCQGGNGHCYLAPTVRFHGDQSEGLRALAVALQHRLPVKSLNRHWQILDMEPVGPNWEIVFWWPDKEAVNRRATKPSLTEADLTRNGFTRFDVEARTPGRKGYAYSSPCMVLNVMDGGSLDGAITLDHQGGNVVIHDFYHLKRLVNVMSEGSGYMLPAFSEENR